MPSSASSLLRRARVSRRGSRHTPGRRVPNAVWPTSRTVSAVDSGVSAVACGRPIASQIGRTARPIGTCASFHSPASPRMLITISAGILYGTSSDVSAFSELPSPLDCSITVGRAPPRYRPAAMPKASSSRVASVVVTSGKLSRRIRRTCDSGLSGT